MGTASRFDSWRFWCLGPCRLGGSFRNVDELAQVETRDRNRSGRSGRVLQQEVQA